MPGQHVHEEDYDANLVWVLSLCKVVLYISVFLLKNHQEVAWWHLWPNNCRFTDSCWDLVIIFMLNLHKPEVVIDILQIDVALPDLSKCQFNWTWNIYSKSNILKLIDTFVPWNQIFQYLVCNKYQHLCISVMYLPLILNQMPISQHRGIIPWVAFLLIQMNMWDCNGNS